LVCATDVVRRGCSGGRRARTSPPTPREHDTTITPADWLRVAMTAEATGQGVLVVLNEEISAARDVWKTDNRRADTFGSPQRGYLGAADPDTVVFFRRVLAPHKARVLLMLGLTQTGDRAALQQRFDRY
jgi:L-asparaginase/Glu-tRNA(Gln) amidotransferase subunit D